MLWDRYYWKLHVHIFFNTCAHIYPLSRPVPCYTTPGKISQFPFSLCSLILLNNELRSRFYNFFFVITVLLSCLSSIHWIYSFIFIYKDSRKMFYYFKTYLYRTSFVWLTSFCHSGLTVNSTGNKWERNR
jgi:hypothetical protein